MFQRKHQYFTPYDYKKVDFGKFQSSTSQSSKSTAPTDSKFKPKVGGYKLIF